MLSLSPFQSDKNTPADRTLVAAGGAVVDIALRPGAPTPDGQRVSIQKARFVGEVFDLAKSQRIPIRNACHIVATRTDLFPDLYTAGKKGASLIGEKNAFTNYNQWLKKLGTVAGTRKPNITNWVNLLDRYTGSRPYVRQGSVAFWVILANLYEHPNKLSLDYAYRLASIAWSKMTVTEQAPTYAQVYHYYDAHADKKAVIIAREGEEYFLNNVAGYITREAPAAGVCWFSDHHIFDCAIRIWDHEKECWRAVRPWLTAWMDWGSLYFTGIVIRAIYPNRDAIERSLRLAIEQNQHCAPENVYIDNGRDYKSLGFAKAPLNDRDCERLRTVAEQLGCKVTFAQPYNARAKLIERQFRVVCEQFAKLWPSYRGSNPEQRPETADAAWSNPETLPTLSEFQASFQAWLTAVYHATPSRGETLKGKCPSDAWRDAKRKQLLTPEQVYKAFLRDVGHPRDIKRGGRVQAINRTYESDQLYRLLGKVDRVRVKLDVDDLSVAYIYTLDGRELGMAREVGTIPGLSDGNPATIEAMREQQKNQRRQVRAAKQASAANRDLSRFRPAGGAGIHLLGVPPVEPAVNPARTTAPRQADDIDPAMVDEFEQFLRNQTAQNKNSVLPAGDIDEEDAALLAEIENRGLSGR